MRPAAGSRRRMAESQVLQYFQVERLFQHRQHFQP
jgi:hypothetical protein